jgi:hypothetical protein
MECIKPQLPKIAPEDHSLIVDALLEFIAWQGKQIEALQQQILELRGETTKPDVKPSVMDAETEAVQEDEENSDPPSEENKSGESSEPSNKDKTNKAGNKRGLKKRKKTAKLAIHQHVDIRPQNIPVDAVFKGWRNVVVQDLKIEVCNTCYRLAQYQTADGTYISGEMAPELQGSHFGKNLVRFILYQYHHQHVTLPLLHQQLLDFNVEISAGQLSKLVTDNLDLFHEEKDEILKTGLDISNYIHTDDTGARHKGKNGYCTHIGNEFFAWFNSTFSKSRINFLTCLSQGGVLLYVINSAALSYMEQHKLPKFLLAILEDIDVRIEGEADWEAWLDQYAKTDRHRRIMTEGALTAGLLAQGIPANLTIMSDDAGQFNVFDHALCWIHAERIINRLIPISQAHIEDVATARGLLWGIYRDLKAYKMNPESENADEIRLRYDAMCVMETSYTTLKLALKRMAKNKDELLRVLDKPWIPLHNNLSERDIRDYVKKRKISGGTRSDKGRKARDTFASLKKTCRKHNVSFWKYLEDRLFNRGEVLPMADLIRAAATCD